MNGSPYLSPRLLQLLGVLLLIGSAGFWAVTDRQSVPLMSAAMSLIGLGAYGGARDALARLKPPPREGGGQ